MRTVSFLIATVLAAGAAEADVIHLTGSLNNAADPLIIGPGINGADPVFDLLDAGAGINNVAAIVFRSSVTIEPFFL